MTRRKFLGMAAAIAATATGGSALAKGVRHDVVVTHHRPQLTGAAGLRIVHLTDLHVGWSMTDTRLDEVLSLTHEALPNLVVLTGDYLNHSVKHLSRVRNFFEALPRPCVATLGNHDYWSGVEQIRDMFRSIGVPVLINEHHHFQLDGVTLAVVGVDDSFSNHDDVERSFAGLTSPEQALVLTHHPNVADEIAAVGGRLIVAGHTHGGQVDVPVVTQAVSRTIGTRYLHGWYTVGDSQLYVNAGIGSSAWPIRVGERAAPEVAIMDLVDEDDLDSHRAHQAQ